MAICAPQSSEWHPYNIGRIPFAPTYLILNNTDATRFDIIHTFPDLKDNNLGNQPGFLFG
ncbi:MAG: hypothetical protein F6K08_21180 [Okeania sp. SIO1H6]|nr:hypothetical protein [Okeania sp. SIO1H6]NET19772.1 hypothetical protein [Okeania sp. SIO1H5]NET94125.1 hypothetical protein [Okeania sp. SIO1H2]